ncbi:nucleotide pyrophosphatase/phosphodiesterase, partial [Selaginella moellendorffii]|uniref:nucleotide pyrophosphatase/phosphodiesterase n=1 Tax=Selaginella moellendorffii TaxID=88036 RepID=UPI000D1D091C
IARSSSVCVVKTRIPAWGPYICSAPIKFQYANQSQDYVSSGSGQLTFRLINQRANFSFGLFSGFAEPVLIAVSNVVTFDDLKMPLYPRLAQGRAWNEDLTDDCDLDEQLPSQRGSSIYNMAGAPASTIGWRDPGQIHTGIMTDLWPTTRYSFQVGHRLQDASFVMSPKMYFHSPPFPGQESLQRVVIFGDMGTHQRDGSRTYFDFEPGSLNTTDALNNEINDIDIVFHIGDISYATGYLSEWDQFTEQIENLSSKVPYMTVSGNHERDWPNTGSFYNSTDSGGECGVVSSTVFNMPVQNRDKFWYKTDYGLFRFCIADSEHDWRDGTEQYEFLENCFRSADRQKQPWLVFISHRVLGYSSCYAPENTTGEPFGRDSLEKLWQKHKVDLAFYGHIHNYERTYPLYNQVLASDEKDFYSGTFNGTIHVVAGGGGFWLSQFPESKPSWSLNQDCDFGYTKLTSFNRSSLLFEYKKSRDGEVYDQFWIHREYKDVLGCDSLNMFCPLVTSAENYPA